MKDDIAAAEALATQLEDLQLSLQLLDLEVRILSSLHPKHDLLQRYRQT